MQVQHRPGRRDVGERLGPPQGAHLRQGLGRLPSRPHELLQLGRGHARPIARGRPDGGARGAPAISSSTCRISSRGTSRTSAAPGSRTRSTSSGQPSVKVLKGIEAPPTPSPNASTRRRAVENTNACLPSLSVTTYSGGLSPVAIRGVCSGFAPHLATVHCSNGPWCSSCLRCSVGRCRLLVPSVARRLRVRLDEKEPLDEAAAAIRREGSFRRADN